MPQRASELLQSKHSDLRAELVAKSPMKLEKTRENSYVFRYASSVLLPELMHMFSKDQAHSYEKFYQKEWARQLLEKRHKDKCRAEERGGKKKAK